MYSINFNQSKNMKINMYEEVMQNPQLARELGFGLSNLEDYTNPSPEADHLMKACFAGREIYINTEEFTGYVLNEARQIDNDKRHFSFSYDPINFNVTMDDIELQKYTLSITSSSIFKSGQANLRSLNYNRRSKLHWYNVLKKVLINCVKDRITATIKSNREELPNKQHFVSDVQMKDQPSLLKDSFDKQRNLSLPPLSNDTSNIIARKFIKKTLSGMPSVRAWVSSKAKEVVKEL